MKNQVIYNHLLSCLITNSRIQEFKNTRIQKNSCMMIYIPSVPIIYISESGETVRQQLLCMKEKLEHSTIKQQWCPAQSPTLSSIPTMEKKVTYMNIILQVLLTQLWLLSHKHNSLYVIKDLKSSDHWYATICRKDAGLCYILNGWPL